jgi:hypothetical protein
MKAASPSNGPALATHGGYRNNPLIDACGPILSGDELVERLFHSPPVPGKVEQALPPHVIEHELFAIRRLHVPSPAGIALAKTLDILIRQGYVHRNPSTAATWERLYNGPTAEYEQDGVQLAATVVGISGAGKSTALIRALRLKPQVVVHERFPNLVGAVRQLLWLKIDVPASGKIRDLVESWAAAADEALGTDYLSDLQKGRRRSPESLAREWVQRMGCHFPGLLVLDEIQNLFKIERKERRAASGDRQSRLLLRVVDDEALKMLLTLINACRFPVVVCGTPDGIDAFGTRMSTSQRLVTGGFHRMAHSSSPDDVYFRQNLLPLLFEYQWLPGGLALNDEVANVMYQLSAGLPRLCGSLLIHAQRLALEAEGKALSLAHIYAAAAGPMATTQPAVRALLSRDPGRMALFEDLLPTVGQW